ncbi:DUF1127 domain-containing protein [Aquipseudomonas ullengensis]|uniref:DUF1127 domain-containing protein n=1 Tax=Aquipseudomonas ullengensis TaxID=2759166 RepID=A0A7W4LJ09_9GAMM|nr:DUF1127 domain-containing protein [Pseudomonas ullengensis]MBB2494078.1 DUF1127 domain-containing protein [Pseudomonas ullengensis]
MRELSDLSVTLREHEVLPARLPLRKLAARWQRLCQRLATRRALLQLDSHLLDDIGLTAEQARQEATRPFWQLLR